jgi:DnaJ family protein C protein 2
LFELAVLEDEWTQDQQNALEMALLNYPPSVEKHERWTKIANEVPNKNKQQCLARYKYLKEFIAAKRHENNN